MTKPPEFFYGMGTPGTVCVTVNDPAPRQIQFCWSRGIGSFGKTRHEDMPDSLQALFTYLETSCTAQVSIRNINAGYSMTVMGHLGFICAALDALNGRIPATTTA